MLGLEWGPLCCLFWLAESGERGERPSASLERVGSRDGGRRCLERSSGRMGETRRHIEPKEDTMMGIK